MRVRAFLFLAWVASVAVLSGAAEARQVVTPEDRVWARRVLEEEKALSAVGAPNTVAVLYFENATGLQRLDPLQKGFAVMLITDLSKVEGLRVVERVRIQALAEELQLGASGLVAPETAPRVGRLLQAYYIVGGRLLPRPQDAFEAASPVLKTPTESLLGTPAAEGILEEIFRMEKELLFEILELLAIEVSPEEEAELRKPFAATPEAAMHFFFGIDAADRARYDKAADYYSAALAEDPAFTLASDALQELRELGLIQDVKTRRFLFDLRDRTSLTNQLTPKEVLRRVPDPGTVLDQRTPRELPSPPEQLPPPPSK